MRYKPKILIDLDGVLNEYKGNYDENFIPEIREGAREFVKELTQNYILYLFTTRNENQAKKWLENNDLEEYFEDITNTKIPAYIILDDRGVRFDGDFRNAINSINNFRVWYKQ